MTHHTLRHAALSLLMLCTLTAAGQQKKTTTTQKAKTTATTQKKATPAKKTTTTKKKTTQSKKRTSSSAKKVVPTTKDIQKLQNEQANLQKQIKESEKLLQTTKKDVKSQLANLAVINGRISAQQTYVTGIQNEVDTLTHNIGVLSHELALLEEELAQCKQKYAHGVMYMYRNRMTQNKLMFIFSADNFQQMYRRLRYAQEYTKYQRAQGKIVQQKEEAVALKKADLERTNTQKRQLLEEGKKQQIVLEGQKKERQTVVDQLNKKQKQLQSTLAEQQKKNRQLNARIDQLVQEEIRKAEERRKAEEAKRRAEEERRRRDQAAKDNNSSKSSSKKSKSNTSSSSSSSAGNSTFHAPDNVDRQLSSNFAANQGRLPVPITGGYVISAHYGPYSPDGLNGVTLDNKGTNYTGKAGAQARCIFDGEVTSIFSLGGLTNILVRHGSYISVYCNLTSASVRVGQKVTTRQLLGPVARDASGNVTLHFQLRKETAKLNPERWIGR